MQFITNDNLNHSESIRELIANADELLIAVAFFKQSGLNLIEEALKRCVSKNAGIIFIVGQHFALTEPLALYRLRNLLGNKAKFHLANVKNKDNVFHPKLYLIRNGHKGIIICGSANITKGGLVGNTECSLMIACDIADDIWKDAYAFMQSQLQPEYSEEAGLLAIGRYEEFYESQKKFRKNIKAIPTRSKKQLNFNYANLRIFYDKYKAKGGLDWLASKHYNYREARKVLDAIANDNKLSKANFAIHLDALVSKAGEQGWWHSGSLFRNRRSVYNHYKAFQNLVRYIKDNKNGNASVVFDVAKNQVSKIDGAGTNYVTEIMMTYNSKDFANLNNNPVTVLTLEGGVHMKATPSAYTGTDYEKYCDLVKEISNKIGLRDMLEADAFFNDIYWQIKDVQKAIN